MEMENIYDDGLVVRIKSVHIVLHFLEGNQYWSLFSMIFKIWQDCFREWRTYIQWMINLGFLSFHKPQSPWHVAREKWQFLYLSRLYKASMRMRYWVVSKCSKIDRPVQSFPQCKWHIFFTADECIHTISKQCGVTYCKYDVVKKVISFQIFFGKLDRVLIFQSNN